MLDYGAVDSVFEARLSARRRRLRDQGAEHCVLELKPSVIDDDADSALPEPNGCSQLFACSMAPSLNARKRLLRLEHSHKPEAHGRQYMHYRRQINGLDKHRLRSASVAFLGWAIRAC